jgi:DNA-binding transcriptional regulator YiaG
MTLKEYLEKNDIKPAVFADSIDKSRQAVWYWLNGDKYPSRESMKAIKEATGGQVDFIDWF